MKKKMSSDNDLVTRSVLRGALDEKLQHYPTKADLQEELKKYPTKVEMGVAFENLRSAMRGDMEKLLIQFRSDMYSRFDQIVGDTAQIKEEMLFVTHDIHGLKETDVDHEKRIKKLETPSKN